MNYPKTTRHKGIHTSMPSMKGSGAMPKSKMIKAPATMGAMRPVNNGPANKVLNAGPKVRLIRGGKTPSNYFKRGMVF